MGKRMHEPTNLEEFVRLALDRILDETTATLRREQEANPDAWQRVLELWPQESWLKDYSLDRRMK